MNGNTELICMNAYYFVPGIGRFASADTIVPDPADPQSYNRYSYVLNSPVNFTDPTGHRICEFTELDCDNPAPYTPLPSPPMVTRLWIDPELVTAVQFYGNTNFAFGLSEKAQNGEEIPSYAYSQGFHGGIDLIAEPGTTVYAGVHGKVVHIGFDAYKPAYIKIEIAPNTYMIIGHLSSDVELEIGQMVNPDTIVGTVSAKEEHIHIEFWNDSGGVVIESPYGYMSNDVKNQFFDLAISEMEFTDDRITFHLRIDGLWQDIYDQPSLRYRGTPNLNDGQPGYVNPWE